MKKKYRHELKYVIGNNAIPVIRSRLSYVMHMDENSYGSEYTVRSLYYDTADDKSLYDKIDGVDKREKWRLRTYNYDSSLVKLECKHKKGNGIFKESITLSNGYINNKNKADDGLFGRFTVLQKNQNLSKVCLIDYEREAFVYPYGTVRVTLDKNIRVINSLDISSNDDIAFPILDSCSVLEVKWTEYIPSIIKELLLDVVDYETAFSKYALCRQKMNENWLGKDVVRARYGDTRYISS